MGLFMGLWAFDQFKWAHEPLSTCIRVLNLIVGIAEVIYRLFCLNANVILEVKVKDGFSKFITWPESYSILVENVFKRSHILSSGMIKSSVSSMKHKLVIVGIEAAILITCKLLISSSLLIKPIKASITRRRS